jgi:hypothetical protein
MPSFGKLRRHEREQRGDHGRQARADREHRAERELLDQPEDEEVAQFYRKNEPNAKDNADSGDRDQTAARGHAGLHDFVVLEQCAMRESCVHAA